MNKFKKNDIVRVVCTCQDCKSANLTGKTGHVLEPSRHFQDEYVIMMPVFGKEFQVKYLKELHFSEYQLELIEPAAPLMNRNKANKSWMNLDLIKYLQKKLSR